ncbi:sodium:proline symporter [Maritimibacter sp. 55A14]|uniref:sodium:proline symporter n=1 Tax=Maritimibacter sp. 55A14 TaxID=2174844 RepID=UPI000D60E01E|nr:sodium:proline symporter [Maritimibacter sp. 55A14]PWE33925.1 sodium:proline symporter [Maritimibacter sp. 55A14]
MDVLFQAAPLVALFAGIAVLSIAVSPRRVSIDGFFAGRDAGGDAPGLWTLVFSQVTTWIFARSLMNAAILGYFYGLPGVLAYTAYYGSFLTGGYIVARVRAQGGRSLQGWLSARYGAAGVTAYNAVIGLRLLSEVFANLLVVGLIVRAALPEVAGAEAAAVWAVTGLALVYSALGGLRASLRTDVVQMGLFLVVFALALPALLLAPGFSVSAVLSAPGASGTGPGWILLAVAFLQVFSYPAHDPVMMDRGFLADPATTRRSFTHAFWISALCIFFFGLFGVQASIAGAPYEGQLLGTWQGMFGPGVYFLLVASLAVSALSTLDSALASASRLVVEELRLLPRSLMGGRVAMAGFALAGAGLTLWGNSTLFDAVAVSGTASLFLTPVLVFGLALRRRVALWAYLAAFGAALAGAVAYFLRDSAALAAILPEAHKYEQLLWICAVVLLAGFVACWAGSSRQSGLAGGG